MKHFSTRCIKRKLESKQERQERTISNPTKQTLDFLKQFARVYHPEVALGSQLAGMILN